jgi:hypothetical protein
MAITLHCEHCGKEIKAAESAGGKWGKCPSCHNKLYVPAPDSGEKLNLAPIDEDDEKRKNQLMAETYKLTQDILEERDIPDGPGGSLAVPEISDKNLTKNIILYLRQMADGELDEATKTADLIAPYGQQAIDILDRIALSEIPEPELADVPQQVLAGLIRNFRTRIS